MSSENNMIVCCDPYKLRLIENNNNSQHVDNLLQNFQNNINEIQNIEMQQANEYVNRRTIKMRVLKYVSEVLQLPWTYKPDDKSIFIHPDITTYIDEKWNKCLQSFTLSHDEMNSYKLIKTDDYVSNYDLTKFIGILVRRDQILRDCNSSEKILRNNDLNVILGVDGFYGYECNDMKNYLENLKYGFGDNLHVDTVRKMYRLEKIANLSGTDAACIVFSALLKVFNKYIQDDESKLQLKKIYDDNNSYLIKSEKYFGDIASIREDLSELTQFYEKEMTSDLKLDQIARLKCSAMISRFKKRKNFNDSNVKPSKRGRKKIVKEEPVCLKRKHLHEDDQ